MADVFVNHLPEMEKLVEDRSPPFVAVLYRTGTIQIVLPKPTTDTDGGESASS
jgi:hypothetical protein